MEVGENHTLLLIDIGTAVKPKRLAYSPQARSKTYGCDCDFDPSGWTWGTPLAKTLPSAPRCYPPQMFMSSLTQNKTCYLKMRLDHVTLATHPDMGNLAIADRFAYEFVQRCGYFV